MTKTNKKFAVTCKECDTSVFTCYGDEAIKDHLALECEMNKFLADVNKKGLKRIDIDSDLAALLKTTHNVPFSIFKWPMPLGFLTSVFAPEWVREGINLFHNFEYAGMTLVEFLTSLDPK